MVGWELFSLGPSSTSLWSDYSCMCDRHHFRDDSYNCSETSQTPITTIHILKSVDDSYSNIKRAKYKDNEKDYDKDTDNVPEKPNIC